jgi:hypothetical protein
MSHHPASPTSQTPNLSPDRMAVRPALRSPGLAAMTRRYLDGEVDLRKLLAFNGTAYARPRSPY